jgi:hypothetical protein
MDVLDGGLGRLSGGGTSFVGLGEVTCGLKSRMEGGDHEGVRPYCRGRLGWLCYEDIVVCLELAGGMALWVWDSVW